MRDRPATKIATAAARTHEAGEGTEHTNTYGGSTAHAEGGGTEHTNTYGGTTSGAAGAGAVHTTRLRRDRVSPAARYGTYPAAYHPPVAVPYYASGLLRLCGRRQVRSSAWLRARRWLPPTRRRRRRMPTPRVSRPEAPTPRRRRRRLQCRRGHGRRRCKRSARGNLRDGVNYAALPAGSMAINKNGQTYYLSGNTWFQPAYRRERRLLHRRAGALTHGLSC